MLHPINESKHVFELLVDIVNNIEEKNILDFGGNKGNLLHISNGKIKQKNYTCIDVNLEAINKGKEDFPQATFLHWNKFNPVYNHSGNKNEPLLTIGKKFDIALAYSVITHTDWQEFKLYIEYLKQHSNNVIVSFIDINNKEMKAFFYNKRCKDYGSCVDFKNINNDYFYLIDNKTIIKNTKIYKEKCNHFINFHSKNFLLSQFKNTKIVDNHIQSLLII